VLAQFRGSRAGTSGAVEPVMRILPRLPKLPALAEGTGRMTATVAPFQLSRSEVEKLLPPGFELGALPPDLQRLATNGKYPVIMMMGSQRDVKPAMGGIRFPVPGLSYKESALVIPGIRYQGKAASGDVGFNYVPVLYLNKEAPILLGHAYGFHKRKAKIDSSSGGYSIAQNGRKILDAKLSPARSNPGAVHDNLGGVLKAMSQPIITDSEDLPDWLVKSTYDLRLAEQDQKKQIKAVDVDLALGDGFDDGKIDSHFAHIDGADRATAGAFQITDDLWHLSAPPDWDLKG
jgi:hypothetical protein